jgi:hypothetical protein
MSRANPAELSLKNLLGIVDAKLDLCGRLPIFEYEARSAGLAACATAFRELAVTERQSVDGLLVCLRKHLDQNVSERDA